MSWEYPFYEDNLIQLLGGIPTPLKNDGVSSSVGVMTFPTEWNN